MEKVNVAIIGAGVIGLSVASELSNSHDKILLLERHESFGRETSSRNSEVIHAGIYYQKNSLKAKTCAEGSRLLYELCEKNNIPHKKTGKLIVAVKENEISFLEKLLKQAKDNGVSNIGLVESKSIKNLEPNVKAIAALYSRDTGIIDSHALMKCMESNARKNGVDIAYNVNILSVKRKNGSYKIKVKDADGELLFFESEFVINSAGLESDNIAASAGIDINKNGYLLHYCKGDYFRVCEKKAPLIKRLVYPVPKHHSEGLGIHATPDLGGGLRLGPDHSYIKRKNLNYDVLPDKRNSFFTAVKSFLPFIEEIDLRIDTAGIRPRLYAENEGERDFIINEESSNGLPGFINLIGIESPGLTSALPIAKLVNGMIKTR